MSRRIAIALLRDARPAALALLSSLFVCSVGRAADEMDFDRVKALAISFFRDSTEVPMNVEVTTVVTDPSGKVKHRGQGTAGMIFNGYNQGSHKFSLRANAGMMSAGVMRDSVSGDLAAFFAGGLIQKDDAGRTVEIRRPDLVIVRDKDCPELALMQRWMFPDHPCGTAEFTVGRNAGGNLAIQRFTFDSGGAPGAAKVEYLGEIQVTGFRALVEFQEKLLPGDAKPYLWPLMAETSVTTSKGKVTITNRYSAKSQR